MKTAIVLAAGKGTRAWPFSGVRQKVTLPVLNVPIVRRLVLSLIECGFEEIVTVTGFLGGSVRACLADLTQVRFVEQRQQIGTADATLSALDKVKEKDVLICYGDIATPKENIERLCLSYESREAPVAVLGVRMLPGATHWISIETQEGGLASRIVPRGNKMAPKFAGVTAASTDLLAKYLLRNPGIMDNAPLGGMPPLEGDLSHSLDLMALDRLKIAVIPAKQFVVDVDKPWQLVEGNVRAGNLLFRELEGVHLEDGASIDATAEIAPTAAIRLGPGARIGKNCCIKGSLVAGAGTHIENGATVRSNVFVGNNSVLSDFCCIGENSVIGSDCVFGHASEFIGIAFNQVSMRHFAQCCAVLGANVNIAGGVMTSNWRFDDAIKTQSIKGHREKPENFGEMTYIGDYTRVGNNVTFSPGVKVGYYTCLGSGLWINEDMPERTLVLLKQDHIHKEWGPDIYGW